MDASLRVIGTIHSPLSRLEDCPKQGTEGAPEAWVEIFAPFIPGLDTLQEGQEATLLTWMHMADRDALRVHPRGNENRAKRGVFNTRSPGRPNPIGLHEVRILEIKGNRLRVFPLEALDGTPLLDIKTAFRQREQVRQQDSPGVALPASVTPAAPWGAGIPEREAILLRDICHRAWQRGLLSGFNGNVSLRLNSTATQNGFPDDVCLITCTGSVKGMLSPGDLAVVRISTGERLAGGIPSSEAGMHLEIYRNQPDARAVVHTHPPRLLALGLRIPFEERLRLPIFEAEPLRSQMTVVRDNEPGTQVLARDTGLAAQRYRAVIMERHGLTCWGENAVHALGLSEEIEHLAGIHLDYLMER